MHCLFKLTKIDYKGRHQYIASKNKPSMDGAGGGLGLGQMSDCPSGSLTNKVHF